MAKSPVGYTYGISQSFSRANRPCRTRRTTARASLACGTGPSCRCRRGWPRPRRRAGRRPLPRTPACRSPFPPSPPPRTSRRRTGPAAPRSRGFPPPPLAIWCRSRRTKKLWLKEVSSGNNSMSTSKVKNRYSVQLLNGHGVLVRDANLTYATISSYTLSRGSSSSGSGMKTSSPGKTPATKASALLSVLW